MSATRRQRNLEAVKKYRKANAPKVRDMRLKLLYGISREDWEKMLTRQEGRCAICSERFDEDPRNIHVDHDHVTGKVRDLLCGNCNRGLGCFRDNEVLLFHAQGYLRKHA